MITSLPSYLQGILLTIIAGLTYFLTYRANELLDGWALYAQGINLVFLPAGIKHISILIAGKWGALGCLIALFTLAQEFWQGAATWQIALYCTISTAATWLGIVISMQMLGISKDLSNLRFFQLPKMDLITTAIHGFTTNAFFILTGMKSENFLNNAFAMMLGDFIGSFVILTLLWLGLIIVQYLRGVPANIG